MVKKRLTLSLITFSVIAYGAPVDLNETGTEVSSVDLGDVEFSDTKIKAIKKKRVKSYSPATPTPQTQPQDEQEITLDNLSKIEIKSADVAEAIAKNTPSVSLVRRSGIANDLIVRGLKKDNIAITIDGMKIYGACPNRMDPPLSHVLANNIESIEVKEGTDVATQGAMGAAIKVHTLEPTKNFSGDVNLGLGSWGYQKLSTYFSGGVGDFRFAIGLSTESSDQYKDGDGNDFAGQQDNYISTHPTAKSMAYKPDSKDLKAYTKSTFLGKIYWDITDNQTLKFSYTANRSDNILYPNTPMDADYDNSDLYNLEYEIRDLGAFSKNLTLQYYHTKVDHPMSNSNRLSSIMMGITTHHLTTDVKGGKIKNNFKYNNHNIEIGLDYSKRNWDGLYYKNGLLFPEATRHSIWDVDTKDTGVYIKDTITLNKFIWDLGLRYDNFDITTPRVGDRDRDYNALTGNLMLSYLLTSSTKLFIGGSSGYRVPDGKELYYRNKMGIAIGNDNLDGVRNYEIDAGFKYQASGLTLKVKGFYNYLKDYILYNSTAQNINGSIYGQYQNVDAYIYGAELSGGYRFSKSLMTDFSLAWLRGQKDNPLAGQTDKDLPEIPPLRVTFGVDYMPTDSLTLRAEFQGSDRWTRIDSDNGEQEIAGWGVINLKLKKSWGEHFEVIAGIDNLFDQKYAVSNTYKDLTLITGGDETMLMNEPGRYAYVNFRYKF